MYTYKLGGMLITDELYHEDLEAMTFGRKDQNELRHHGIKGQSWGKRRFQNEDGSLTAAGRNRYDVGDPKQGVTAYSDTGGRGGSGVNYYRTSGTGRPSTSQPAARVVSKPQSRGTGVQSVNKSVAARANSGKKAADNLFGRIGNWASNAAKDVGNFAANTYNDASKAVTNVANDVGKAATNAYNDVSKAAGDAVNWVGDRAQDVGNAATNAYNDVSKAVGNAAQGVKDWYTGDKAAREAQRYDNVVQNFERNGERNINEGTNTISRGINAPDSAYDLETGEKWGHKLIGEGVKQRELGYDQHDIAREYGRKADEAQGRYENAPRQLLERAGNWVGDRANDAKDWIGDRANDVGNAVGGAYDSVKDTVTDAAQGVKNWYTGEGDKRSADWYRDLSTRDTDWFGTGRNLIENHQAVANESRAMADALRKSGDYEGAKRYEQNAEAYQRAVDQMTSDRNRNLSNADMYDERYNNAPRQVLSNLPSNISNAVNAAGNWAGNAAKDVGNWATNAASDVRDWGAGALDKGRQAFENLFGRSEPAVPTLSDPNPQIETETILRENIIPEQRITEQRIPEQRITENRIEEQRIAEKQAPGGFNSRPLTKEENEIELKRVNDRLNNIDDYYDHLRANNNPQWSNFTKQDIIDLLTKDRDNYQNKINQQQEAERARALSDKPSGLSDEYWMDYISNGGTRESYDREMKNRKSSAVPLSSDKDYAAEQERLRNISAQQDRNGFRVEEVNAPVGTVDTSRPYHFTLDPVSGQTVVVYDDEKRR